MIKKIKKTAILFGILITTIFLGNTTLAGYKIYEVGLDKAISFVNSNYEIGFLPKARFLTDYLGTTKAVIGLDNQSLIWWLENGRLYMFDKNRMGTIQGYFNYYSSCNELTLNSTGVFNCSTPTTWNSQMITNFLDKVKSGDYIYIYRDLSSNGCGGYCTYDRLRLTICFSSSQVGKSLCILMDKSDYCPSNDSSYCTKYPTNVSLNLTGTTNFGNLSYNLIGDSPAITGTNSNIEENIQCPTIKQVMSTYGYQYYTGLCYNNTTYFNGTTFEQIEQSDIFTIFNNDYQNYSNRVSIYRNNCTNANTTEACQRAFSGEYKKYSIIANANQIGVDEKKLRNYCNLGLNYDPNATTCVASGTIKESYTAEEEMQRIYESLNIPTPNLNNENNESGYNNIFNALCNEDDTECFNNQVYDIFKALSNIYGKITGIFKERNGVNGIIPDYILWLGFLTILFTIIFKK